MTIDKLRSYSCLICIIKDINDEIENTYLPITESDTLMKLLHDEIERCVQQSDSLRQEIDAWLQTIDSEEIRRIVTVHYIDGPRSTGVAHTCWTWSDTCQKVYGYPDDRYARRKFFDWFKKHEVDQKEGKDS